MSVCPQLLLAELALKDDRGWLTLGCLTPSVLPKHLFGVHLHPGTFQLPIQQLLNS